MLRLYSIITSKRAIRMTSRAISTKKIINTRDAPTAIGPYSQAVQVDKTLYLSGQIGMDPQSGELVSDDVSKQAKQALDNLGTVLKAAGADYQNVVKATILLTDMNDFAKVNDVYAQYFTREEPARAAFQAAALPKGAKVEIEAIACINNTTT